MKMTFGRKFIAGLFAIGVLVYIFTLVVYEYPQALSPSVVIVFAILVVTVCFMYIGGNIWKSWIKSKYFQPGLAEKGQ